ncbi:dynein light intermediate chain-domain-containing protein [Gilbertella persicaria]|uniref:dynein light intermediate chain-domain-containing protein n=1 Tax=Gilbertella persicaria TaxID=101096 RepID=UPI00221F3A47|nr:dynein light intermediate chain-domain-containing protein [Gilbertella persicaria]KAI8056302.1 dynein light intermediate chain-domain-containing protein [Gilbertella persicaria]
MSDFLSSVTPSQSVSTNSILTQQQQSFIPEKDEIWSSILKSVASTKMVPTKNVLILGEPGVGKSTLVQYLKNDPGPQQPFEKEDHTPFSSAPSHLYTPFTEEEDKNDLALGYTYVDVKDEENEAMARLGLYQLGLSSSEFFPLLKFAIRAETIADACVVILLDWTRPWKFVETLERWISILHSLIDEICKEGMTADSNWSKGRAMVDELKEKLEHYLQTYTEPSHINKDLIVTASTSTSSMPSIAASTSFTTNTTTTPLTSTQPISSTAIDHGVMLPLPTGCLTTNLGIPITVVCCKSDAINTLEQTHDYTDDQFDYIQQTLRCICMKYGAALFYTSTLNPYTFHNLREYILHRTLTTSSKPYPFHLKAQVIERDTVLVPSGWDSWGKIKVLREGFECDFVSEGWDADMDAVMDRQKPANTGARGNFEEAIPNGDASEIQPQHIPVTTMCEDEQSFYDRHYEKLQKNSDTHARQGTGSTEKPGVVGPLAVNNNSNSGQNAPSHEVLANFFQSLLKTSGGASSGGGTGSPTSASILNSQPNGRTHKDLDVMKQYTASIRLNSDSEKN